MSKQELTYRKAIYTLAVKRKDDIYDICLDSIRKYAEKIGADFIVRYKCQEHYFNLETDYKNVIMEKFFLGDLLTIYDRVLYVDGDILIKDDAPDIFGSCYNGNCLYLYNEVAFNGVQYDKQIEVIAKEKNVEWTKHENGHYNFYNAGVMLMTPRHKNLFEYNKDEYFVFPDLPMIVDEPYLHYNIFKHGIPVWEMPKEFNTMVYFEDDGYFLHFANVLDRVEKIKKYI